MKYFFPTLDETGNKLQGLLLRITAVFLCFTCISITFAPAVRLHSWRADYQFSQWIGFAVWLISFSVIHYVSQKRIPKVDPFIIPITGLLSGGIDYNFQAHFIFWASSKRLARHIGRCFVRCTSIPNVSWIIAAL